LDQTCGSKFPKTLAKTGWFSRLGFFVLRETVSVFFFSKTFGGAFWRPLFKNLWFSTGPVTQLPFFCFWWGFFPPSPHTPWAKHTTIFFLVESWWAPTWPRFFPSPPPLQNLPQLPEPLVRFQVYDIWWPKKKGVFAYSLGPLEFLVPSPIKGGELTLWFFGFSFFWKPRGQQKGQP